jgi:putative salt-induced outer membrane protein
MKRFLAAGAAAAILAAPALAQGPEALPDIVQALLNEAYATEDPVEIAAVARAVKGVFPDYADPITAQAEARIAAATPPEAPAEETDAQDVEAGFFAVRPWKGKVQAGASFASGNSDNLAVGLALDATRTAGDFAHNVTAFIDVAESEDVVTQKRWGASYQLDWSFSERSYAYGRFSYEEDEFSGFDYRLFAGAGVGHFLYKSEPFIWKVEGGPGFRYSPIDDTREIDQQFAAYASTELDWIIRDGVVFEQDVNVTWTEPTTTIQSISALTTDLTESISTSLAFEYRYETDPPPGRVNDDTVARASIVYGF